MALPKQRAVELPLIKEIAKRGGQTGVAEKIGGKNVNGALADFFNLSSEDLSMENSSDKRSKWENRVRQARRSLVDNGVMSNSTYGIWELTEKGLKVADFLKDKDFTRKDLENIADKGKSLDGMRKLYDKIIAVGVDKNVAISIVLATDCECVLKLMDS